MFSEVFDISSKFPSGNPQIRCAPDCWPLTLCHLNVWFRAETWLPMDSHRHSHAKHISGLFGPWLPDSVLDAEVLGATWLVCVSVGPQPEARAAERSAEGLWGHYFCSSWMVCLSVHSLEPKRLSGSRWNLACLSSLLLGTIASREIPDSISRFPGNGKNRFLRRQCLLWAPFSREWKSISQKRD